MWILRDFFMDSSGYLWILKDSLGHLVDSDGFLMDSDGF